MNFLSNPKTLTRLWAGMYCDFERVIASFMGNSGWRYPHFAVICRELKITLALHITQGRGKTKDDHYYRYADLIFQLCKGLWLRTDEDAADPGSGSDPNRMRRMTIHDSMELKRSLGGFYLLYTLYEKQPIPGRGKIAVGVADMIAMRKFARAVKALPFHKEVEFMMACLFHKEAFHFCAYPEDNRFDATTRYFANQSQSPIVDLTRQMRDAQDALAYSAIHQNCEFSFANLTGAKNVVAREMIKTVNSNYLNAHFTGKSAFPFVVKTLSSEALVQALRKIDVMVDKPVVTLQALTATEAVDRVLATETRKRMERARRKAQYHYQPTDGSRVSRPYVREGGIFGRKKEANDQATEHTKRRERGVCSGNLFIYINGYDFDKPCGGKSSDLNANANENAAAGAVEVGEQANQTNDA